MSWEKLDAPKEKRQLRKNVRLRGGGIEACPYLQHIPLGHPSNIPMICTPTSQAPSPSYHCCPTLMYSPFPDSCKGLTPTIFLTLPHITADQPVDQNQTLQMSGQSPQYLSPTQTSPMSLQYQHPQTQKYGGLAKAQDSIAKLARPSLTYALPTKVHTYTPETSVIESQTINKSPVVPTDLENATVQINIINPSSDGSSNNELAQIKPSTSLSPHTPLGQITRFPSFLEKAKVQINVTPESTIDETTDLSQIKPVPSPTLKEANNLLDEIQIPNFPFEQLPIDLSNKVDSPKSKSLPARMAPPQRSSKRTSPLPPPINVRTSSQTRPASPRQTSHRTDDMNFKNLSKEIPQKPSILARGPIHISKQWAPPETDNFDFVYEVPFESTPITYHPPASSETPFVSLYGDESTSPHSSSLPKQQISQHRSTDKTPRSVLEKSGHQSKINLEELARTNRLNSYGKKMQQMMELDRQYKDAYNIQLNKVLNLRDQILSIGGNEELENEYRKQRMIAINIWKKRIEIHTLAKQLSTADVKLLQIPEEELKKYLKYLPNIDKILAESDEFYLEDYKNPFDENAKTPETRFRDVKDIIKTTVDDKEKKALNDMMRSFFQQRRNLINNAIRNAEGTSSL